MKKDKKKTMFLFIENKLDIMESVFLIDFKNANSFELMNLKRNFYNKGISIKMVKSKIIKKVYENNNIFFNTSDFKNSTFIVWKENDDLIELSKELISFKKNNKNFIIKSCYHKKKRINLDDIEKISSLGNYKKFRESILHKILKVHNDVIRSLNNSKNNLFYLLKNKQ